MDIHRTREIGHSGVAATPLALGGTGLGNMFKAVSDEEARSAVVTSFNAGARVFDIAPVYGYGLGEKRLGAALKGLARDEFVICTKVGYRMVPLPEGQAPSQVWVECPQVTTEFDFSYDFAMRSVEESLKRLGVDRVDLVAIHDPDEAEGFQPPSGRTPEEKFKRAMDGTYRALDALRAQGTIRGVGIGTNQWKILPDYARAGDFDYFMLAGHYTLLEHETLDTLLPVCTEKGVSLLAGGPFNSGILSVGAAAGATYHYVPAPPEILAKVAKMERLCADFGISLRAAALQFPLRHPTVASSVPGARNSAQARANIDAIRETIPEDFWSALKQDHLIDPRCP